jgi:hypothetical protein
MRRCSLRKSNGFKREIGVCFMEKRINNKIEPFRNEEDSSKDYNSNLSLILNLQNLNQSNNDVVINH